MIGYPNPEQFVSAEPNGIDIPIKVIQLKLLNNIAWLSYSFGRAFRQQGIEIGATKSNKKHFYPEVYQKNMEPMNVMPNDNLKSYCFFYTKDPTRTNDYNFLQNNSYTTPVSLIFWFNLKKIDATKDFRFTEKLKGDVLTVLRGITTIKINEIFDNWENIFADFTVSGNTKEYIKPPYSGFRIDFDLTYNDLPVC